MVERGGEEDLILADIGFVVMSLILEQAIEDGLEANGYTEQGDED